MLHYIQATSQSSESPSSSNNAEPNAVDANLDADHPRCTQFKKWQASRSWLMCESNKVFCTVCRRVGKIPGKSQSAFVEGITHDNAKKLLKKIDKHCHSDTHKKSVECIKQADKKAVQNAFEAARRGRIHMEHEQTIRLFRTAYTVAKVHLSFSAYTELVELQILNGLDMGTLLFSDHACANIIEP